MKKTLIYSLGLNIAFASIAFGQSAPQPTTEVDEMPAAVQYVAAPISVEGSSLKDVGLWGYYESVDGYDNLPSNLWLNSDVPALGAIFSKLSENQKFTPLQFLTRRVILSGGLAPNSDTKIATERFRLAAKLGPLPAANLLNNYPNIIANQDLLIIAADVWFYQNRSEDACNVVEATKPQVPQRELLELRATCYALNNEVDAAQLSLDLAMGQNPSPSEYDVWFSRAIAALGNGLKGEAAKIPFRADNGRTYALSRKLGLFPTAAQLPKLSAMTLSALSLEDSSLKDEIYLNAAIKGAISPDEYAKYKNDVTSITPVPPIEKQSFDTAGNVIVTPVEQPPIKGENYYDELSNARDIQAFAAIAKRIAPKFNEIDNIKPAQAEVFANAAILASDIKSAKRFAALAPNIGASSKLALGILANDANAVSARVQSGIDLAQSPQNYYSDAIIANATGLKARSTDYLVAGNLNSNAVSNENILYAMDLSANRNAMAETALLAALSLQGQDPKAVDAVVMARVIANLKKAGLAQDAKELAVYTIMAKSLVFKAPAPPVKATETAKPASSVAKTPATKNTQPVKNENVKPAATKTDTATKTNADVKPAAQKTTAPASAPKPSVSKPTTSSLPKASEKVEKKPEAVKEAPKKDEKKLPDWGK